MAWIYRQSVATTIGSGTQVSQAITPQAVGNLLIVYGGTADIANFLAIADTADHTWTRLTGPQVGSADLGYSWITRALVTTSMTVFVVKTGGVQFMNIMIDEFTGGRVNNPIDSVGSATGSGTPTSPTRTPTDNNCLVWGAANDSVTAVGAGFTKGADDLASDWTEHKILSGGAGVAQTVTFTGSGNYNCHIAILFDDALPALEQEGYRWRNDDGTEATATWKAAQDTTVTLAPNDIARLRTVINGTRNVPNQSYRLQYRKVGDPSWRNMDTIIA